jgi:hypothetical protein
MQVSHPSKLVYDYWLPLTLGTVATIAAVFGGVRVNIFGEYGTVHGMNQLLQILVGFYVAALAAVATFNGPSMDEYTAGTPLCLGTEQLTRRRFISLLFGHLAVIGFGLYIVGATAMASAAGVHDAVGSAAIVTPSFGFSWLPSVSISVAAILRAVFAWLHFCLSAHLVIVTLHGVYFLAIRMHTIPKKPTATNPPQLKEAA